MYKMLALLLIVLCFRVEGQTLYQGKAVNANTDKEQVVYYSANESKTGLYYLSQFKVYGADKKLLLFELNLINNNKAGEISYSIEEGGETVNKVINYNPLLAGIFYSNQGLINEEVEVSPSENFKYSNIFSFKDSFLTYAAVHKISLPSGVTYYMDPIKQVRVDRHKAMLAKVAIYKEGQRKVEEDNIRALEKQKEQKRLDDSIQIVLNYKRVADSLSASIFNNELLGEAAGMYKNYSKLKANAGGLERALISTYSNAINDLRETNIEGEYYTGEKYRRRKNGIGLLFVTRATLDQAGTMPYRALYKGWFKDDKFDEGDAYKLYVDRTIIAQYVGGKMNGTGVINEKNGNRLWGTFEGDNLRSGISMAKNDGDALRYFGSLKANSRTGYGELFNDGTIYVGKFADGKLEEGLGKEVDGFGNITFWKFESGKKLPSDGKLLVAFWDSLEAMKKREGIDLQIQTTQDRLDTIQVNNRTKKYIAPNYIGLSLGGGIPLPGFSQAPTYAIAAPTVAIDCWFRMANAIGFKLRIGVNSYSVGTGHKDYLNDLGITKNVRTRYDMLWLVHHYSAGLGLNLGGKRAALEISGLGGAAVVHKPKLYYPTDQVSLDKGKLNWCAQAEMAIRINCTKKFAFRFGANYFVVGAMNFNGYAYDKNGYVMKVYDGKDDERLVIHSVNPFISFLGLF